MTVLKCILDKLINGSDVKVQCHSRSGVPVEEETQLDTVTGGYKSCEQGPRGSQAAP